MEIKHLYFSYGKKKVLENINVTFERGAVTTLMGSNGCGKSTLLNICSRNLQHRRGRVLIGGKRVDEYKNKDFAKELAIVYQQNRILGDISVEQLVSYGRTPYLKPLQRHSKEDREFVDWALDITDLKELRESEVRKLSGGQRQRVFIAMALAQDSQILLLDEPTTYLDIRYQIDILSLIRFINKELGKTIVMVLHDIMQAINYSDKVVGLSDGRIVFDGRPNDVLDSEVVSSLYGTELVMDEYKNTKIVLPKEAI